MIFSVDAIVVVIVINDYSVYHWFDKCIGSTMHLSLIIDEDDSPQPRRILLLLIGYSSTP